MSNGWAVRSKGKPYFAFVQMQFAGMNPAFYPPGAQGPFRVALEIAFDSLPTQYASADEYHRLFAYQGYTTGGVVSDLLGLAITPSGRLVGLTPGGGITQSGTGVIVADGITHELALEYTIAGFATIFIDGTELVLFNSVPSVTDAMPAYIGQIMLLNSVEGLTRCACRVRKATYTEQYRSITWAIDDGFDRVLKATPVATAPPGQPWVQNFDLTAIFIDPPASAPWGPLPDPDALPDAYAWLVSTAYTRIAPPSTAYERTQV